MVFMGNIIAQRLHDVVQEGELGYDYTFDRKRDKNQLLRRKYGINDNKMKEILLKITGSHYVKSESSINEIHHGDMVHIFKISEKLMPKFDEMAEYTDVMIYIKVTWPAGEEPMFIISFHEDEE